MVSRRGAEHAESSEKAKAKGVAGMRIQLLQFVYRVARLPALDGFLKKLWISIKIK